METYKDLTIDEINEEATKLRAKLQSKWLTNWQRTCIEDELDDIDRELERRYDYER